MIAFKSFRMNGITTHRITNPLKNTMMSSTEPKKRLKEERLSFMKALNWLIKLKRKKERTLLDAHKKSLMVDSSSSLNLERSTGRLPAGTAKVSEATLHPSTLKMITTPFRLWLISKMGTRSGSVISTKSSVLKTSHGPMILALKTTPTGTEVNQTTQGVKVAP